MVNIDDCFNVSEVEVKINDYFTAIVYEDATIRVKEKNTTKEYYTLISKIKEVNDIYQKLNQPVKN